MSSEEETEFGLYTDKLLKKAKRTRQRVDAGEPRNSYSSIPNFSSRPSFLGNGTTTASSLYSAIFSQHHQQFGLFGPGFAPAKMLNELLGRQKATAAVAAAAAAAAAAASAAATGDSNSADGEDSVGKFEAQALMMSRCGSGSGGVGSVLGGGHNNNNGVSGVGGGVGNGGGDASPPQASASDQLAHHMLRDILQGRKHELLALEHELRVSSNGQSDHHILNNNNNGEQPTKVAAAATTPTSVNNNNITSTNNNHNNHNHTTNSSSAGSGTSSSDSCSAAAAAAAAADVAMEVAAAAAAVAVMKECLADSVAQAQAQAHAQQQQQQQQQQADLAEDALNGMETESLPSPKVEPSSPAKPEDAKKARVENIVSGMRSSPIPPTPTVNGCKKRKLYQPQQHDSNADRYIDDEEEIDPEPIRQKRVEKNALKSQLRTMQEQLAEMQQKYVQLCTRMDQGDDSQEIEEIPSDSDSNDKRSAPPSPSPSIEESPIHRPHHHHHHHHLQQQQQQQQHQQQHHPHAHHHSHLHAQQQSQQHAHHTQHSPPQQQHHHHHGGGAHHVSAQPQLPPQQQQQPPPPTATSHQPPPSLAQQVSKLKISPQGAAFHNGLLHHHDHHHISNAAAAMYLGVSHKLLLEQEARLAKEVAAATSMAETQPNPQIPHQSSSKQETLADRLSFMRTMSSTPTTTDIEGLADVLKTEITASLGNLIDSIVIRFLHQRRCKNSDAAASAEQLNKDLMMATQLLDRKSPRTKVADRPSHHGPHQPPPQPPVSQSSGVNGMAGNSNLSIAAPGSNSNSHHHGPMPPGMVNGNGPCPPMVPMHHHHHHHPAMHAKVPSHSASEMHSIRSAAMFQPPKPPGISQAALYAMNHPFCVNKPAENPEQNEALSLVVTPKKKRHKVTDTRITPRTVSRILGQDGPGMGMSPASIEAPPAVSSANSSGTNNSNNHVSGSGNCPSPRPSPYHPPPHPPPPMLPVSLPTSVAIPNPGLHESQVFSPYSPFFHGPSHGHHMAMQAPSPPRMHKLERESPPIHHPPTLLHPALLAAAQHGGSPDYGHIRAPSGGGLNLDNGDRNSDCNSGDISYDGMQPTSSTLTPMHLRKAKLMFFWVRYPSSAVLKMYFPDIKFNKNNTAQLVKWFSNFREFYYIQMEKYARQAVSEGVKNADDLHVSADSELYRVLNLHYNRNNHIEVWGPQVPSNFRFVVEQTLREFFKAIQEGRDAEQSWKKSIYKIISRLDDPVPEYFKSPNFLEQLE